MGTFIGFIDMSGSKITVPVPSTIIKKNKIGSYNIYLIGSNLSFENVGKPAVFDSTIQALDWLSRK